MRETAPVIMKNTPKQGTVLNCTNARCIYTLGSIITHSDTPRQLGKMTNTDLSRIPPIMMHAKVKTND